MKAKLVIFELFICALIFISAVAIEQSKDGKQLGATEDVISKVETVGWKPWGGRWINYGEKGGAGRKNGEQGSGGNHGRGSSQGGGEQKGGGKEKGSELDGGIRGGRGESNENVWRYLRDWKGDVGSENGGNGQP